MRFLHRAIIAKGRIAVPPNPQMASLWPFSFSSLPTSVGAAACWYSTSNNDNSNSNHVSGDNITKGQAKHPSEWLRSPTTTHNLSPALNDHLAQLSKRGLHPRILEHLISVAVQCDTKAFDDIVGKVYSAVSSTPTATDVEGPGMSLSEFRELVAGCRADAPAVQQLLASLDYDQREELESLAIGEVQQHFGTTFPAVCRDWLFVALVWDGRRQTDEALAIDNATTAKKQQQRQGTSGHTTTDTHAPQHSNSTTSTHIQSAPSERQHAEAVTQQQQQQKGASDHTTTKSTQPEHQTKPEHKPRALRFHAAAVALQILRDEHYCLPLRPGSVTHMTHTITASRNAMLGQASYVDHFSKELVKSFEPGAYDRIPFFTNYSTPRAGKTTVLLNGLRTAPLATLESLTSGRSAFVVVAGSFNNKTTIEKSNLQAGTDGVVEEAFFAVDWRLVYAMVHPLLKRRDDVGIAEEIARAAAKTTYRSGFAYSSS